MGGVCECEFKAESLWGFLWGFSPGAVVKRSLTSLLADWLEGVLVEDFPDIVNLLSDTYK